MTHLIGKLLLFFYTGKHCVEKNSSVFQIYILTLHVYLFRETKPFHSLCIKMRDKSNAKTIQKRISKKFKLK
jgi:hypothetical protein